MFNSQTFANWINGTHRLYLFLDTLDQGWLKIIQLPTLLVREFRKLDKVPEEEYPKPKLLLFLALKTGFLGKEAKIKGRPNLSRLYLRLVCRPFHFSQAEEAFKDLWSNYYSSYDLMPLSESDIKSAFNKNGLDADQCWQEITDQGFLSLAIKPISLQFLIKKLQKNNEKLSQNQNLVDIYLDGYRELCREPKDETRHPFKPVSTLEVDQRLSIAARIAAVMTFCLRPTIWTGQSFGDYALETDVRLGELCGQCENTNSERGLRITSNFIQEVLDTGLFSSRELNRMKWAHQTYAEFLAAWYLTQHEISLDQIKTLLFSSEDPDHKLIPQLHETAAWLASMRIDVLQEIVKTDPDVLLRSDIPTDANFRELLVGNLLIQYEEGKLFDPYRNNYGNYKKLNHPGLVDQLRPYICDSTKPIDVRNLAIDIAEVCEISELQEELADIVLDLSQSIYLRVNAARAIGLVGDAATRLKLKPLAIQSLPEDEDDRLKGYILQALWSDYLTAEELFQALTPPKKFHYFGSYQMFLNYQMVPQLAPNQLVIALNWLEKQGLRDFGHPFEELGNAILLKAWDNFDIPGVAESFTTIALIQWRRYKKIITSNSQFQEQFASSLLNETRKRHILLEQAVLLISETDVDSYILTSSLIDKILVSEDIYWMLDKLQNLDYEQTHRMWAKLIRRNFNRQDVQQIDAILVATQANDLLREIFAACFTPVELDSDKAKEMKAEHIKQQEMQARRQNPQLLDQPPQKTVIQLLKQLETGDLSAWLQLNRVMTLKPDGTYRHEFELDLTQLPGWQDAEEKIRNRIIEGANKYIQQFDDINYEWIGTNTDNQAALAGCKALQLLLQESPDFIDRLPSYIWKKWASIIIAVFSENQIKDSYLELVKRAYINAPEEFIKTLRVLIDKKNQHENLFMIIHRLEKCWDKRLQLAILEKAKDPTLKAQCIGQLLEKLVKQELTEAKDFAQSLISLPLPLDKDEQEKVLIAARILVENSDSDSWSLIWKLIEQDSSFGRKVLELVAERYSFGFPLNLTETQLADLYIWLVRQYPDNEDPDYSNEPMAHIVTAREGIGRLRDSVLSQLEEKGSLQACDEIQRIIQEFSDVTWLGQTLINAQVKMRRTTWQPPTPEELLQLVVDQDKRLVQSGQHLLEILIESLERLELELQGETPAARDLWDKVESSYFRPLDENAFSDYVKRFLDRDIKARGIIANREVELRRSYGGNSGERTDIHVDAVLKHPNGEVYDSITVIIEVKGCWHSEVQTAMQTQLVERYLLENPCPYGLYLVGWFNCQQWDNKDSRNRKAPRKTIDEAKTQFNTQAKKLSSSTNNMVRAYVLNTALR